MGASPAPRFPTVRVRRGSPGLSLPRPTVRPVPPSPGPPPGTRGGAPVFDPPGYAQATSEVLGTAVSPVTLVLADLETAGGSPQDGPTTGIGADKASGGDVIGEG